MITIYKTTENHLETIEEPVNNCWINVIDPTPGGDCPTGGNGLAKRLCHLSPGYG